MVANYTANGDMFVAVKPRLWTKVKDLVDYSLAPDGRRFAAVLVQFLQTIGLFLRTVARFLFPVAFFLFPVARFLLAVPPLLFALLVSRFLRVLQEFHGP